MINDKEAPIGDLKLCYVCPRDRFAWFTSIELEAQWGDDWNDAPYEHNAGDPYSEHKEDGKYVPHHLVKVAWDGPYSTPADLAGSNSSWSVQGINRGCVAWLVPDGWGASDSARPIPAGTSLVGFIEAIEGAGGHAYVPRELGPAVHMAMRDVKMKRLGFNEPSAEQLAENRLVNLGIAT
jgi:hypothetical protein